MDKEFDTKLLTKDAGFDLSPTTSYQMMVALGKTSFASAVFDPEKKKFVAFLKRTIVAASGKDAWFAQVKQILEEEELMKLSYKNIRVLWESQCATLVPAPLFELKQRRTYLQFNQKLADDDVDIADNIRNADAYNIFAVPEALYRTVGGLHPRVHHHSSVLIESLLLLNRHNINPMQVYVNVHSGFFDMVVINDRKLRFYNSFAYSTAEDFIYFVLFVFEQLKLMPEKILITLSGEIETNSAVYDILYKYVRNLTFAGPIGQVTESYILKDVATYQFQNLFNTILCEL
jgi:hypothetical protein